MAAIEARSQAEIAKTVKGEIRGLAVKTNMQIIVPNDTPTPKLESRIVRL